MPQGREWRPRSAPDERNEGLPASYYDRAGMTELVFFYGTLMTGFRREGRARIDLALEPVGHGWISAVLFDLGIYPAAIPAAEGRVRGEVHRMLEPEAVLATLDEIEGYRPEEPEASLYVRRTAPVTLDDGRRAAAWVYFYNAPLGAAQRIPSGDYLAHIRAR